jgi:hypothetical protein
VNIELSRMRLNIDECNHEQTTIIANIINQLSPEKFNMLVKQLIDETDIAVVFKESLTDQRCIIQQYKVINPDAFLDYLKTLMDSI